MKPIQISQFHQDTLAILKLRLLSSDAGMSRLITQPNLMRPGLPLAGFLENFTFDRIQILGNTEILFLNSLSRSARIAALSRIMDYEIPCFVISNNNQPPDGLLETADNYGIPVFVTELTTTVFVHDTIGYLEDIFAPRTNFHGTLVDVYGTGLLLTGKSGIGKSEVALDLVERGHRLVADDIVLVKKQTDQLLMGASKDMFRHMMEIRGLGFIDVRHLFGIRAIRLQKRVETQIELFEWDVKIDLDRTGLDRQTTNILGVEIPLIRLPIFPGKNITVICETIALNLHLSVYGYDASREFNDRLLNSLKSKRISRYLNDDTE